MRVRFTAALLASAGAMATAAPALAQDAQQDAPAATDQRDQRDIEQRQNEGRAGDIVVTARTRAETLGDVPIAGAVLSGDSVRDLVVDRSSDLVNQLPATSLVISGAEYTSDIAIRGQGVGRLANAESTTGIYRNGVYVGGGQFGGRTFSRMDLFDVQRVESFRGPQGALYGRNAVGGSINVLSARPSFDFSGRINPQYRFENEEFRGEAVVNAKLSEIAAVRVGGIYSDQNDGFHHDAATGEAVDKQSFYGGRVGLRVRTGRGELNITGEAWDNNAPSLSDIAYTPDAGDPDPYTRKNYRGGGAEIRERSLFLEWDYGFDFADLRLSSNAKWRDGLRTDDIGHLNGLTGFDTRVDVQAMQTGNTGRYSADLRLLSPGAGRLQWLIGADVQGIEDKTRTTQDIRNNPFTGARRNVVLALNNDRFVNERLFSWSAFGSLGYDITDRLNITAELRYQADEKEQRGFNYRPTAATVSSYVAARNFDAFTPGGTLTYKLGDRSTAYARIATGYRPGGFNDTYLFQGLTISTTYDKEYTTSYELGWKGNPFGLPLYVELAGFRADTKDVQLVTRDPATGSNAAQLLNAASSTLYGLEASAQGGFRVGPGRLALNGSIATQWGDFGPGSIIINNQGTLDLSGKRVTRTRDYIGNMTLSYSLPVGGGWRLTTLGNVRTEGGGFENLAGSAGLSTGRRLTDFTVVNGRITLGSERMRLSAFVKNLFDERYDAQALSVLTGSANFPGDGFTYLYNEPRSFGVEGTFQF